jgi:hypothetical protein
MTLRRLAAIAFVLVAFAGSTLAQNLATNGDFDTDIAGWAEVPSPNLAVEWSSLDHRGNGGSGSLLATNTAPGSANLAVVSCVSPVTVGQIYQYSGFVRVPTGQTGSGGVDVFFYWYDGLNCGGTQTLVDALAAVGAGDHWNYVSTVPAAAPAGTKSAWLAFSVAKGTSTPSTLAAYVDGMDFRVTLFHDGFESASTLYWSSTH